MAQKAAIEGIGNMAEQDDFIAQVTDMRSRAAAGALHPQEAVWLCDRAARLVDVLRKAIREVEGFEKRTGTPQFAGWVREARALLSEIESDK